MDKVLGENVQFRIEVEDSPRSILLVLDRKCNFAILSWEDAFQLAETMQLAINDVIRDFPTVVDPAVVNQEQAQVRLNHHKGLVALVVDWTDRIRFTSIQAFFLLTRALRHCAQDAHLAARGVHFVYDRQGFIKKLTDHGGTQIVR